MADLFHLIFGSAEELLEALPLRICDSLFLT